MMENAPETGCITSLSKVMQGDARWCGMQAAKSASPHLPFRGVVVMQVEHGARGGFQGDAETSLADRFSEVKGNH